MNVGGSVIDRMNYSAVSNFDWSTKLYVDIDTVLGYLPVLSFEVTLKITVFTRVKYKMYANLLCVDTVRHICLVQPALSQLLNSVLPRRMTWLIELWQITGAWSIELQRLGGEGKQAFFTTRLAQNLRAIWAWLCRPNRIWQDRTIILSVLSHEEEATLKKNDLNFAFNATELVKKRYKKASVRFVVD